MRPGFEFLQELIDKGYIDAKTAYTYEAIEGEALIFGQKTPIVMAYWEQPMQILPMETRF